MPACPAEVVRIVRGERIDSGRTIAVVPPSATHHAVHMANIYENADADSSAGPRCPTTTTESVCCGGRQCDQLGSRRITGDDRYSRGSFGTSTRGRRGQRCGRDTTARRRTRERCRGWVGAAACAHRGSWSSVSSVSVVDRRWRGGERWRGRETCASAVENKGLGLRITSVIGIHSRSSHASLGRVVGSHYTSSILLLVDV